MGAWFTYWHIVAALVLLAIALIYLAYRLEVRAEDNLAGQGIGWNEGRMPHGCIPLLLAGIAFTAALVMAAWKFVWWLA